MGLFSSFFSSSSSSSSSQHSSSGSSIAERKRKIRERYAFQIEDKQRIIDNYKKDKADALWQCKMVSDKRSKESYRKQAARFTELIKQHQEHLKFIKQSRDAELNSVR